MRAVLLLAFLALSATACGSPGLTSKKAKSPVSGAGTQDAVGKTTTTGAGLVPLGPANGPGLETTNLSVSDAIARACGIAPREDKKLAPSFEFDSAALGADDRKMLGDVARCLTDGALRGHRVSLVGRADTRGEPEYNMNLGGSRADSVQRYLQDLGVSRDRLHATSRGELDATGTDETGFAKDRRVDVELVD